jgi:hypothetical protein
MNKWALILFFVLLPCILLAQTKEDSTPASSYALMFNVSTVFYTAQDPRINNFMDKYGYIKPQDIPTGLRFEIAGMPLGGKMIYGINAGTVISKQDIITADLSLGVYRRLLESKNFWLLAGIAVGEHFDRIVLNKTLPPLFDSLSKKYDATLSMHRNGVIVEPAVKLFWYPLKTKKVQIGLFTGIYYDFDFNSRWRVGYYPENDATFKNLRKPTSVATIHEFGWVFSSGLSVCF